MNALSACASQSTRQSTTLRTKWHRRVLIHLGILLLLFAASIPEAAAQFGHGGAIGKSVNGPNGRADNPRVHTGEVVNVLITVQNRDGFNDNWDLTNVIDVVRHNSGISNSVLFANTLTPIRLTPFGNIQEFRYNYFVQAADGVNGINVTNGALFDQATARGTDLHDGGTPPTNHQEFILSIGAQIRILSPALCVSQTCVGPGVGSNWVFVGSVSNCGNTFLTNVSITTISNGLSTTVLRMGTNILQTNAFIRFTNIVPGNIASPFVNTVIATGNDDLQEVANAPSGKAVTAAATAICMPGCLGDFVWEDRNGNGIQDAGEPGIPNVRLRLFDCAGTTQIGVTNTDAAGFYLFCGLTTGTYRVEITVPFGYSITRSNVPPNDCIDSDATVMLTPTNWFTDCIMLTAGINDLCVDFGLRPLGAIGDFVWEDLNYNGLQDLNEPGIPNVQVQLFNCVNQLITTTNTDASGGYLFTSLPASNYTVRFILPLNYQFTIPNAGLNDAIDSDPDPGTGFTTCYPLALGETNRTVDAGMIRRPCLGDFVWEDRNGNGLQDLGEPGIPNVQLRVLDCGSGAIISVTNTGPLGQYLFCDLIPGSYRVQVSVPFGYSITLSNIGPNDCVDSDASLQTGPSIWVTDCVTLISGVTNLCTDIGMKPMGAIGDFVWEDLNYNGLQDFNEPGIPNVLVQLFNCNNQLITATNTDAGGGYLFGCLPASNYVVRFVRPLGYEFTIPNVGLNDSIDSDGDPGTGFTTCFPLTLGQTNRTVDAGLVRRTCLGDFVWEDRNGNGIQDAGEPGIPNVVLRLQDCFSGANITLTNTGPLGQYLFCDLLPGSYRVEITIPLGYSITLSNIGPNDCIDSDASPATRLTDCVTLVSGETNRCTDIGLKQLGAIGDFVWEDRNANGLQDANEPGVANATVRLLDCSSNLLLVTTTDLNGRYLFTNLTAGGYIVMFVEPAFYRFTLQNQTPDDRDSDPNPLNGFTSCYVLAAGQTNLTVDAGLIPIVTCPPYQLVCPPNQIVECGSVGSLTNLAGLTNLFSPPTVIGGSNVVLTIVTNELNTNVFCPARFTLTRIWRAVDACTNVMTCSQAITVVDTLPPNITCGDNRIIECNQPVVFTPPYAVDVCDDTNVIIRLLGTLTNSVNPRCPGLTNIIRTWSASDRCGNSNICSQTISIVDTTPPNITCADDQIVECNQPLAFTPPYAVDACEGTNVIVRILSTVTNAVLPRCPGLTNIIRTWSASDSCGNSNVCSQVITLIDTTPPNITCAANRILECNQPFTFTPPFAVDGCEGTNVTIRVLSTITNSVFPRCPNLTNIVRTWSASDSCGNSNICSQTITIIDTTPPNITCERDKDVECNGGWAFDIPTAVDGCDANNVLIETVSTVTNLAVPRCPQLFSVTRTWRATDSCGNASFCNQTVTVYDTAPPSITCSASKIVECNQPIVFLPPFAIDACDGTNVIVRVLGTVTTAVSPRCPGLTNIVRTWSATDTCGNSNVCSQTITIVDTLPPQIVCADNQIIECNQPVAFTPPFAVDACEGTNVTIRILSTVTTTPNPRCPGLTNMVRTWSASDSCGNSNVCSQTITIVDTLPPSITCANNQIIECNQPFAFTPPFAVDACEGTNVVIRILSTVTTTPNPRCPGLTNIVRTWSASDSCGNSNICSQTISIIDTLPPSITCAANQIIECNQPFAFTPPFAVDACEGTNVTIRILSTVTTAVNPRCPGLTNIVRTWSASDSCGNSNVCSQTISIIDTTPPNITCADNQMVECNQPFAFTPPFAVDACEGTNVVIRILSTVTTTPNPRCPGLTNIVRTWSASDSCGNSNICSQTITIIDTLPPSITCANNQIIECNQPFAFTPPFAVDACEGTNVTIRILSTVTTAVSPRCPGLTNIVRTWSASDSCGNSNICSQTFTIIDTTPPNITCADNEIIECNQPFAFTPPFAVDACEGTNVTIRILSTVTTAVSPRCPGLTNIVRTWSASDSCGNSNVCSQTISIIDTTPPNITCADNQIVECNQPVAFTPPFAVDACEGTNVTIRILSTVTTAVSPRCPGLTNMVRTWSASDSCGNSNVCSQIITIVDTLPPSITCANNQIIECNQPFAFTPPFAVDACEGTNVVIRILSTVTTTPNPRCPGLTNIVRTWSASDSCGNSNICSQTISIIDTLPPSITCAANQIIECNQPFTFTPPFAVDACEGTNVTIRILSTVTTAVNPRCPGLTNIVRTWSASDSCGNSNICSQTFTIIDTTPPNITCADNQIIECNQPFAFLPPFAVDACDGTNVIIRILSTVTTAVSPRCPGLTNIVRTWSASDSCGNSNVCTQTITIIDTTPPNITCADNQLVECNQPWNFIPPFAVDACEGTNVVIRILSTTTNIPNPRCPNLLSAVRLWSASDSCGNSNICSQTITVIDTLPPEIVCRRDRIVECGIPWNFDLPSANDACDGILTNLVIVGLDITNRLNPNCSNSFAVTRTWRATDSCTNSSTCSQTILVVDTTPPVLNCQPNRVVECGLPLGFGTPTAYDLCGGTNVTVVINSTVTNLVTCGIAVTRTWTATDRCGNSESCSQTIVFIDTLPPVLTGIPGDITVRCPSEIPPAGPVNGYDLCDTNVIVTVVRVTNGVCPTVIRTTWTGTDDCSNTVSQTQFITIQPLPPQITAVPQNAVVCLGSNATFCVGALNVCPLNYQWLFNGAPLAGQTNSCLTITNVGTPNLGRYCVVVSNSCYSVTNCAEILLRGSIGDFVWEDLDRDGCQDPGEPGVSNIVVELLGCVDNIPLRTTMTDINGRYRFDCLEPGAYRVRFFSPSAIFGFTIQNGATCNAATDSDPTPGTGITPCFNLPPGTNDLTHDAGLIRVPACIGDFVWEDLNRDGIQNDGNTGISNVVVQLIGCGSTNVIRSTNTDVNGIYMFCDLLPGNYRVRVVVPSGFEITIPNATQDCQDSDADANGISDCRTLLSGQSDFCVDFGLFRRAAIGDYVWRDLNTNGVQDANEPPVPGVLVKLMNCAGTVLATTNTDANGRYLFAGLLPGGYNIMFVLPGTNYSFTLPDQGANDALDSDANQTTGMTVCYTLLSGQTNLTVDAGLVLFATPPQPRIDIKKYVKRCDVPPGVPGTEGLTPGFWKTHSRFGPAPLAGWPQTSFDPLDSYETIFNVNLAGAPTLLDALSMAGGGVNALMRHSAAALLNASHPNISYAFTVTQVIEMTRTAINSGNAGLIESTKNAFAIENEKGADLTDGMPIPAPMAPGFGADANQPPGVEFVSGQCLMFTYAVTNTGTVPLTSVVIVDDNATPADPSDDFVPAAVLDGVYNVGDLNRNNLLDPGEQWLYVSMSTAVVGDYCNIAVVTAVPVPPGAPVTDSDPACWTVPPPPEGGACRVTGGGRQESSYPPVRYVTHGGQVGAPVGNDGFDPGTFQREGSECIHGNWEHVRHDKGGNRGNFHAKIYDSLMCACLGCPENPGSGVVIGDMCNPDDRICGPEPRRAPANKICFSGIGDYTMSSGNRTPRAVLFRVDIEDRSEPGNSHAGGSTPPHDRHRIRMWVLSAAETARLNNPNDRLLDMRRAIACTPGTTPLQDGAVGANGLAVPLGTAVFGIRAPDVDDGGVMDHGNHQIHPMIKDCP